MKRKKPEYVNFGSSSFGSYFTVSMIFWFHSFLLTFPFSIVDFISDSLSEQNKLFFLSCSFAIKIAWKCFRYSLKSDKRPKESKMQFTLTDILCSVKITKTSTTSRIYSILFVRFLLAFVILPSWLNGANNVCVIDDKIQLFRIFFLHFIASPDANSIA